MMLIVGFIAGAVAASAFWVWILTPPKKIGPADIQQLARAFSEARARG